MKFTIKMIKGEDHSEVGKIKRQQRPEGMYYALNPVPVVAPRHDPDRARKSERTEESNILNLGVMKVGGKLGWRI